MRLNFIVLCVLVLFRINPITACSFSISQIITNPTCGSNGAIEVITSPPTASKIEIFIGNSVIYQSIGLPSLKTPPGLGVGIYKIRVKSLTDNCEDSVLNVVLTNSAVGNSVQPQYTKASCTNSADGKIVLRNAKPGTTFQWSHSALITDSIASNLPVGKYFVTITNASCSYIDTYNLTNIDTIVASATITNENCGRKDGVVNFNITGGNQPYTFAWSDGSSAIPLVNAAAGDYTITITDAKSCPPTIRTYTIKSNPGPQATINVDTVCPGESNGTLILRFTNRDTANYTYTWSHNSTINTPRADGLTPGSYEVKVRDQGGCETVLNSVISEIPLRIVKITGPTLFYAGAQNHYLYANKIEDFDKFTWSPDSFVTTFNDNKALIFPKISTPIIVSGIYDSRQCVARDTLYVEVLNDVFVPKVPNVFTPNGDGINDIFTLYDLNSADSNFTNLNTFEMHIFDRWGNEVYTTTDIKQGWNGADDSDNAAKKTRENMNGVYSYIIIYTVKQDANKKKILSGNITLVK
jgi:gliding motility-associated-like protein